MNTTLNLSKYFAKTLYREKILVLLVVILPILLVIAGSASAPDKPLPMTIDDHEITPIPNGREVSVALYSLTSVVLVSSIISFFLGYNIKHLIPRLRHANYSNLQIVLGFATVVLLINLVLSLIIGLFSLNWVDPSTYLGYFAGIFLASLVFSIIGLLIAELVDNMTLGIYAILTLAIMDTGFIENPVYSRRYNEDYISIMPSHESLQMMLRSIYDTPVSWFENWWIILTYLSIIILIYLLIIQLKSK